MTLYELCDNIGLQSNIQLKVFNQEGSEIRSYFFPEEIDFHIAYTVHTDLEDLQISYIYTLKEFGKAWLVIEVVQEDEE